MKSVKKLAKAAMAIKVTPVVYPLTTVAGRVALLVGITSGTVQYDEVVQAVLHDTATRAARKPVYAAGRRYSSIRNAAIALVTYSPMLSRLDYAKRLDAMAHKIARWCNEDNRVGYYWSK